MIQNLDIARAYLIEANNDFNVVSLLIENNKFSHSFKNKIEIETMSLLEEAVVPLEENWAMSKYPDWRVKPIWIPSQRYNHDNARMNETRMQSVFNILVPFLKINYNIEV